MLPVQAPPGHHTFSEFKSEPELLGVFHLPLPTCLTAATTKVVTHMAALARLHYGHAQVEG
eukprot:159701-Chlamydomonas_euryale.AAC.7